MSGRWRGLRVPARRGPAPWGWAGGHRGGRRSRRGPRRAGRLPAVLCRCDVQEVGPPVCQQPGARPGHAAPQTAPPAAVLPSCSRRRVAARRCTTGPTDSPHQRAACVSCPGREHGRVPHRCRVVSHCLGAGARRIRVGWSTRRRQARWRPARGGVCRGLPGRRLSLCGVGPRGEAPREELPGQPVPGGTPPLRSPGTHEPPVAAALNLIFTPWAPRHIQGVYSRCAGEGQAPPPRLAPGTARPRRHRRVLAATFGR